MWFYTCTNLGCVAMETEWCRHKNSKIKILSDFPTKLARTCRNDTGNPILDFSFQTFTFSKWATCFAAVNLWTSYLRHPGPVFPKVLSINVSWSQGELQVLRTSGNKMLHISRQAPYNKGIFLKVSTAVFKSVAAKKCRNMVFVVKSWAGT